MKKEDEKNKNKESSSSGTKKQKISQSLWCVFCSTLAAEIERASVSKEDEKAKLSNLCFKSTRRQATS
jgi:hypothetical protein